MADLAPVILTGLAYDLFAVEAAAKGWTLEWWLDPGVRAKYERRVAEAHGLPALLPVVLPVFAPVPAVVAAPEPTRPKVVRLPLAPLVARRVRRGAA